MLFNLGGKQVACEDYDCRLLSELQDASDAKAVRLNPDDSVEAVRPFLEQLMLIVVQFPIFRDGRAFTQARALREYEHYQGEIRAEGHILPDQAAFLRQCGVDTVVLSEGSDVTLWQKQLERFDFTYQKGIFSSSER